MRHEATDGVVIRVKDYGDHDRYLTLLTAKGRMTLLSKGGRSLRGEMRAISQLYTYGNYEYYFRGDLPILKGGIVSEPFYGLSADMDKLNLAAYFCDVAYELSDEGETNTQPLLRLLLNSLYALANEKCSPEVIKAAFEFRAAADAGYAPNLDSCAACGSNTAELFYLDVMNGALLCRECLLKRGDRTLQTSEDAESANILLPVSPAVLQSFRYIVSAPLERLLAFPALCDTDLPLLSKAAETYLLSHLGRGFESLHFYHTMRAPLSPKSSKKDEL